LNSTDEKYFLLVGNGCSSGETTGVPISLLVDPVNRAR